MDKWIRDDIPIILQGLQHIYINASLREAVFTIIEKMILVKTDDDTSNVQSVASDKGRPEMDQWKILVLGTLRLALNADYDRVQELAN